MILAILLIIGTLVFFAIATLAGLSVVNYIFNILERKDAREAGEKFDRICEFHNRQADERWEKLKKQ